MQDSAPTHRTKATQDFLPDNARFHQLTRMDTAFARIESARLLSLGYLEGTCLQNVIRDKWHVDGQTVRKAILQ